MIYNGVILNTIKNIIIQININYKTFDEDYQEFLEGLDTEQLHKQLDLSPDTKLKKNGKFERGLYYSVDNISRYTRVEIQKLQLTMPDGTTAYMSVFPSFIIKYNKVSVDLIELIVTKLRKGEDIFTVLRDPLSVFFCEDLLHRACQKVDNTCDTKNLAAHLNARYTEAYNVPISFHCHEVASFRYPALYILYKTGEIYTGTSVAVLSFLNKFFQFLR